MIDLSYMASWSCSSCDDLGRETETGAGYCKASPYGDCECERIQALGRVSELALLIAASYRKTRHSGDDWDEYVRANADVLWEMANDRGGEFDARSWIADCAPVRKARAAA